LKFGITTRERLKPAAAVLRDLWASVRVAAMGDTAAAHFRRGLLGLARATLENASPRWWLGYPDCEAVPG
jgi:hypothetical protein